jgi:hypothetical protein
MDSSSSSNGSSDGSNGSNDGSNGSSSDSSSSAARHPTPPAIVMDLAECSLRAALRARWMGVTRAKVKVVLDTALVRGDG